MLYWKAMLAIVMLCCVARGHADDAAHWLEQYEKVLQQQDGQRMAALIVPGASVRVVMEVNDGEPMIISLSREEFLQQQRALWSFASEYDFSFSQAKTSALPASDGAGWRVAFTQQERYALFGSTLKRENRITVHLLAEADQLRISEIEIRTREW